jgi:Yippee zinc-binding/DNA-binding /Mis18, centromere assembly
MTDRRKSAEESAVDTIDKLLVFQCRGCRRVVSDSTQLLGFSADATLVLAGLSQCHIRRTDVQGSREAGGGAVVCAGCGAELGRLPAPDDPDPVPQFQPISDSSTSSASSSSRSASSATPFAFVIRVDAVSTYDVGSCELSAKTLQRAASAGADQATDAANASVVAAPASAQEERLAAVESTLAKVQQMMLLYNQRLSALEEQAAQQAAVPASAPDQVATRFGTEQSSSRKRSRRG